MAGMWTGVTKKLLKWTKPKKTYFFIQNSFCPLFGEKVFFWISPVSRVSRMRDFSNAIVSNFIEVLNHHLLNSFVESKLVNKFCYRVEGNYSIQFFDKGGCWISFPYISRLVIRSYMSLFKTESSCESHSLELTFA